MQLYNNTGKVTKWIKQSDQEICDTQSIIVGVKVYCNIPLIKNTDELLHTLPFFRFESQQIPSVSNLRMGLSRKLPPSPETSGYKVRRPKERKKCGKDVEYSKKDQIRSNTPLGCHLTGFQQC